MLAKLALVNPVWKAEVEFDGLVGQDKLEGELLRSLSEVESLRKFRVSDALVVEPGDELFGVC
ncbi:hypothetical protein PN416_18025 [Halorubrum ezzemoulense]|uniref:hypothetical protein n=1 Tax=Halorubrum ezzemoulense TaxID=337243 RepID=UPI00232B1F0B|nr:hypothetical protein [Halorubrum ezzemoulense]MDB9281764.1 hypothetical protein [Halorubrum ezzemoulense]MDB9285273.1 hypothetical protein [Halorubrum ezzemoulense]